MEITMLKDVPGMMGGMPVFLNDNLGRKKRIFHWKLKWWQRIFNGFKKYKVIIREHQKPMYLIADGKTFVNYKALDFMEKKFGKK